MSSDIPLNINKRLYDFFFFFLAQNKMRQFDLNSTRACKAIDCSTDAKKTSTKYQIRLLVSLIPQYAVFGIWGTPGLGSSKKGSS